MRIIIMSPCNLNGIIMCRSPQTNNPKVPQNFFLYHNHVHFLICCSSLSSHTTTTTIFHYPSSTKNIQHLSFSRHLTATTFLTHIAVPNMSPLVVLSFLNQFALSFHDLNKRTRESLQKVICLSSKEVEGMFQVKPKTRVLTWRPFPLTIDGNDKLPVFLVIF